MNLLRKFNEFGFVWMGFCNAYVMRIALVFMIIGI